MFLKSLLCLNHDWKKAPDLEQLWRGRGKTKWLCAKCGKTTWRNNVEPPVREVLDAIPREKPSSKSAGADQPAGSM